LFAEAISSGLFIAGIFVTVISDIFVTVISGIFVIEISDIFVTVISDIFVTVISDIFVMEISDIFVSESSSVKEGTLSLLSTAVSSYTLMLIRVKPPFNLYIPVIIIHIVFNQSY